MGRTLVPMSDLWRARREERRARVQPLAVRMRPTTLDEIAGQRHILGPGKLLRRLVTAGTLGSIILHGPPGTGKTTLAGVIAASTKRRFISENAAGVGVARVREVIDEAERALEGDPAERTVLFLDEVHRFSRAQQDVLLAAVERGTLTLIGATTENPLFSVNSALVSRSTLLRLEPLSTEDIIAVLRRALADKERGYGQRDVRVSDDALSAWAKLSDGDARRALTALEVAVLSHPAHADGGMIEIDVAAAQDSIQLKAAAYDQTGDEHYDCASAFIKSLRASDPDAGLYWLARMLDAGEDPRFIARRMAILASEDIGNADPRAIMVAQATWELVERIGMPEARITLAQCCTYLALSPKSNASYEAIEAALNDVRNNPTRAVPTHIKDRRVRKAGQMSAGSRDENAQRYEYTHEAGAQSDLLGRVGTQDYMGVSVEYYQPTQNGHEAQLAARLAQARALRAGARGEQP